MGIRAVLSKEKRTKEVKIFCSTARLEVGGERAEVSLAVLQRKDKALGIWA